MELCRTVVRVVAGPDGSLSDSQTDHTRSIQDSCEGPMGYEVEGEDEHVSVDAHMTDVIAVELLDDQHLEEVGVRTMGQGTENVDPGILGDENLLVLGCGKL